MSLTVRRGLVLLGSVVATWSLLGGVRADAIGERSAQVSTTTSLVPPTSTATAVTPGPASIDPVGEAIRRWFPEIEHEARRIAFCESSLRTDAVSPGGRDHGLFQINTVHRESFLAVTGVAYDEGVHDPQLNARFARWLYDREGWEPWACA